MRLLVDTHVALWVMQGSAKLSTDARSLLEQANEVFVSSASIWEVAIKVSLGKLSVDLGEFQDCLTRSNFQPLEVTWAHGAKVSALPLIHNDPFDRLLVAQALCEPLRLLTADKTLSLYTDLVTLV